MCVVESDSDTVLCIVAIIPVSVFLSDVQWLYKGAWFSLHVNGTPYT